MKRYVLEFEISGLPKTTNGIGRSHWSVKVKEARLWKDSVVANSMAKGLPKKPLSRAALTLTRVSSTCPDSDGLVSSFKHVIDGLITAGVLSDDKYQNIGMPSYRWEKGSKGKGKIIVRVEEVQDDG